MATGDGGRCPRAHFVGESPRAKGHGGCWKPRVKRCPVIFQLHPQKRPLTFQKIQESELFRNKIWQLPWNVFLHFGCFSISPLPKKKKKQEKKSPLTNFPQHHHMAPPKRAWAEFPWRVVTEVSRKAEASRWCHQGRGHLVPWGISCLGTWGVEATVVCFPSTWDA